MQRWVKRGLQRPSLNKHCGLLGGHCGGDTTIRAREPEIHPAGAGSLTSPSDLHRDPSSLQVTVPRAQTPPGLGHHHQPQLRCLGPRIRSATDLHQHRSALPATGQEAALIGGPDPMLGTHHHHLERIEQGSHHGAPSRRFGRRDQHHPFQADAELGRGEQPEGRDAHHGEPRTSRRGAGHEGHGESCGRGAGGGHRRSALQTLARYQVSQGGPDRQPPLLGQVGRPGAVAEEAQRSAVQRKFASHLRQYRTYVRQRQVENRGHQPPSTSSSEGHPTAAWAAVGAGRASGAP